MSTGQQSNGKTSTGAGDIGDLVDAIAKGAIDWSDPPAGDPVPPISGPPSGRTAGASSWGAWFEIILRLPVQ